MFSRQLIEQFDGLAKKEPGFLYQFLVLERMVTCCTQLLVCDSYQFAGRRRPRWLQRLKPKWLNDVKLSVRGLYNIAAAGAADMQEDVSATKPGGRIKVLASNVNLLQWWQVTAAVYLDSGDRLQGDDNSVMVRLQTIKEKVGVVINFVYVFIHSDSHNSSYAA